MAEILGVAALTALDTKLSGLTYLGTTIGVVKVCYPDSHSIPLQEALWNTGNPYNCLWEGYVDSTEIVLNENAQHASQRRLHHSMRVEATMRRAETESNRALFINLVQTVALALAAASWQGMALGAAGSGTQNERFNVRYGKPRQVSKSVVLPATITFRLYNAATNN